MAGKMETRQVNKLLNFDRQLMKTLFNLRALFSGSEARGGVGGGTH